LGSGVVNGEVLEKLGVDSNQYNGWAFVMLKVAPVFFNHTSEKSNNQ